VEFLNIHKRGDGELCGRKWGTKGAEIKTPKASRGTKGQSFDCAVTSTGGAENEF